MRKSFVIGSIVLALVGCKDKSKDGGKGAAASKQGPGCAAKAWKSTNTNHAAICIAEIDGYQLEEQNNQPSTVYTWSKMGNRYSLNIVPLPPGYTDSLKTQIIDREGYEFVSDEDMPGGKLMHFRKDVMKENLDVAVLTKGEKPSFDPNSDWFVICKAARPDGQAAELEGVCATARMP